MDEWARPTSLGEAWRSAPFPRRRLLVIALGVFAASMCVWLLGWVIPEHTVPNLSLAVLAWVPLIGSAAGGVALVAFMARSVRAPVENPAAELVKAWARLVHGLSKVDLDEFAAKLAQVSPTPDDREDSERFESVASALAASSEQSTSKTVEAILAVDPRWQPALLDALRDVVSQENAGVPKRRYSERLRVADPEVRRRVRWSPALLAVAFIVIFAGPIGTSILESFGLRPEWRLGTGTLVGSLGGVIVAWLGVQVSNIPENSRAERLNAIADRLGESREQLS